MTNNLAQLQEKLPNLKNLEKNFENQYDSIDNSVSKIIK